MTTADASHVVRIHRNTGQLRSVDRIGGGLSVRTPVRRPAIRLVHAAAATAWGWAAAVACLSWWFPGAPLDAPLRLAAPLLIAAGALPLGLRLFDAFAVRVRRGLVERIARTFGGSCLAAGLGAATAAGAGASLPFGIFFAGLAAGALAIDLVVWALVRRWTFQGRLARHIVVVGATADAVRYVERAQATGAVKVIAVFEDRIARKPTELAGAPVAGDIDELLHWPDLPRVDAIVVAVPAANPARMRQILERLAPLPNPVSVLMDFDDRPGADGWTRRPAPALAHLSDWSRDDARAAAVRLQDLVIGTLLLVPLLPVMGLIALAVRLDSRGPVFFRQARHGFHNDVFDVFKFRTMTPDDGAPVEQVVADDPRVTRVGRFLRKTSLDELPQIFNVLRGEMSLVGPRPHAVGMRTGDVETQRLVFDYAHRHRVKPGMTGWAQVNGSRGPLHTEEEVRERVRLDLEYVERRSFWLDLWIMASTLPCLLGDARNVR